MGEIEIFGNESLGQVAQILESVKRPGSFCGAGQLEAPIPRVEVKGVGVVPFPVPVHSCRQLVEAASRAPYGKGKETLVDVSVRNTWQINADAIKISGAAWSASFRKMLSHVCTELGLPEGSISAELYKLLVYERGGFFTPHRDTEKSKGMIATLVIALPVEGAGGELVVRHGGEERTFDMQTKEPSEFHYAAFYADCVHEIRPVTEGHRIALVYNLIAGAGSGASPSAPEYSGQTGEMAELLTHLRSTGWGVRPNELDDIRGDSDDDEERERRVRRVLDSAADCHKIVWPLEHSYSEVGISFANLKGIDRTHARILCDAARESGFAAHAAIIHVEVSGNPDGSWYYDHEPDSDEFVGMEEEFDRGISLNDWAAQDGSTPEFGEVPLKDRELVPSEVLEDLVPDDHWVTEDTGNAGATVEHAYRIAALVLWRRGDEAAVLLAGGVDRVVDHFERERTRPSADRVEVVALARKIAAIWPSPSPYGSDGWSKSCRKAYDQFAALGDRQSTAEFLSDAVMKNYTGGENEILIDGAKSLGSHDIWRHLPDFVSANLAERASQVSELAGELHRVLGSETAASEPGLFRAVAQSLASGLHSAVCGTPAKSLSGAAIVGAFEILWTEGQSDEAERIAGALAKLPEAADPFRTLPEALSSFVDQVRRGFEDSAAFGILWKKSADSLLNRSGVPFVHPTDWRIPLSLEALTRDRKADLSYRFSRHHMYDYDREDIKPLKSELVDFCNDPRLTEHRFAARQSLRSSLQGLISKAGLDLDCRTERKGSPHKLVCTKNRNSHRRRLQEYREDIECMRTLISTAPRGKDEAALRDLHIAVDRSSEAPERVVE